MSTCFTFFSTVSVYPSVCLSLSLSLSVSVCLSVSRVLLSETNSRCTTSPVQLIDRARLDLALHLYKMLNQRCKSVLTHITVDIFYFFGLIKNSFEKKNIAEKTRKCWSLAFSSFPAMFFYTCPNKICNLSKVLYLLSPSAFNPFPTTRDRSKFKEAADDN